MFVNAVTKNKVMKKVLAANRRILSSVTFGWYKKHNLEVSNEFSGYVNLFVETIMSTSGFNYCQLKILASDKNVLVLRVDNDSSVAVTTSVATGLKRLANILQKSSVSSKVFITKIPKSMAQMFSLIGSTILIQWSNLP